jgi:hypothetical protein
MLLAVLRVLAEYDKKPLAEDVPGAYYLDDVMADVRKAALSLCEPGEYLSDGCEKGLLSACYDLKLVVDGVNERYPGDAVVFVEAERVRVLLGLVENWDEVEMARMGRYFYQHAALKPGAAGLVMAQSADLIEKYDGDGSKPLEEPAALVERLLRQRESLGLDGHALTKTLELLRAVPEAIDMLDGACGCEHGPLDVTTSELLAELALRLLKTFELLDEATSQKGPTAPC